MKLEFYSLDEDEFPIMKYGNEYYCCNITKDKVLNLKMIINDFEDAEKYLHSYTPNPYFNIEFCLLLDYAKSLMIDEILNE